MKKLKNFSQEYCTKYKIKVGNEYKIIDLEKDPFYGQFSTDYHKQLILEGQTEYNFDKEVWHHQQQITDYFIGEYTETTNEDFQAIWPKFFEYWYWEDIYVCYSYEVLQKEIDSWENRLDINRQRCHKDNPFRLFKLVQRHSDTLATYSSVWTGITYEIDETILPMVWASCNEGMNWLWWRQLLREFVACEQIFIQTQRLSGKRLIRKKKDKQKADFEDANLATTNTVFDVESSDMVNKNNYALFDIAPPEIAKGVWDNNLNWFMTKTGWLGYMQNMNDKKERLTTGENFKDLHAVSNVQYRNLKALNDFGRRFNKVYPSIMLNFNVSNWGEAQGLPQGDFSGEEIDNVKNNENADKPEN